MGNNRSKINKSITEPALASTPTTSNQPLKESEKLQKKKPIHHNKKATGSSLGSMGCFSCSHHQHHHSYRHQHDEALGHTISGNSSVVGHKSIRYRLISRLKGTNAQRGRNDDTKISKINSDRQSVPVKLSGELLEEVETNSKTNGAGLGANKSVTRSFTDYNLNVVDINYLSQDHSRSNSSSKSKSKSKSNISNSSSNSSDSQIREKKIEKYNENSDTIRLDNDRSFTDQLNQRLMNLNKDISINNRYKDNEGESEEQEETRAILLCNGVEEEEETYDDDDDDDEDKDNEYECDELGADINNNNGLNKPFAKFTKSPAIYDFKAFDAEDKNPDGVEKNHDLNVAENIKISDLLKKTSLSYDDEEVGFVENKPKLFESSSSLRISSSTSSPSLIQVAKLSQMSVSQSRLSESSSTFSDSSFKASPSSSSSSSSSSVSSRSLENKKQLPPLLPPPPPPLSASYDPLSKETTINEINLIKVASNETGLQKYRINLEELSFIDENRSIGFISYSSCSLASTSKDQSPTSRSPASKRASLELGKKQQVDLTATKNTADKLMPTSISFDVRALNEINKPVSTQAATSAGAIKSTESKFSLFKILNRKLTAAFHTTNKRKSTFDSIQSTKEKEIKQTHPVSATQQQPLLPTTWSPPTAPILPSSSPNDQSEQQLSTSKVNANGERKKNGIYKKNGMNKKIKQSAHAQPQKELKERKRKKPSRRNRTHKSIKNDNEYIYRPPKVTSLSSRTRYQHRRRMLLQRSIELISNNNSKISNSRSRNNNDTLSINTSTFYRAELIAVSSAPMASSENTTLSSSNDYLN
jgi:hypothetical protein